MCEFCETYKFLKEQVKQIKKEHGINTYFKVRLCREKYKDRIHKGTYTDKPMKIVYCPTCGRKL